MAEIRHVAVLGAGVVGVTSAWYLAGRGLQVTVIDRREAAGLETSFANGGLITPSMAEPWAAPGIPLLVLKWLGREDTPLLIRPKAVPGLVSWGLRFLRECNTGAWRRNTETILRLSRYSHECLKELVGETGLEYDANRRGTLHLFRDQLSMESSQVAAEVVGALGVKYRILDRNSCIELEPALKSQRAGISGGIHYPGDEAGDAHKFAQRLAALCVSKGVEFRYGETVKGLELDGGAVAAVVTDKGRFRADAFLIALANDSVSLLRPFGIRLPIYPIKGYSLTFPTEGWNGAPLVPFVDYGRKMGIVRLGDRVRVAGTAEIAGYDTVLTPKRLDNLRRFFRELFSDYPDGDKGQEWTGLRPVTPDGIPYLGTTPIRGLYLNTGHGHLGWTMSCGSAKAVADVMQGREPEIDLFGMTLQGR